MTRALSTWSGPLTGASFVAGLGGAMARSDHPYPRPGSDDAETHRYFVQRSGVDQRRRPGDLHGLAARFSALAADFAGRSGRGSRALRAATLAGGGLAVASLATAALTAAALTGRRGSQEKPVALARRAFTAGGPVHGVGFGLVVGALRMAGLRSGDLPRPLALVGLASGAANLFSPLYLVAAPAGWLIPIGRFSGYLVIGIAAPRIT